MIPIDKLTEKVLEERFDSLPDNLKEALASDANLAAVVKICHDHYLQDEEKTIIVQQIAALTIMGFVHAEDMGGEINGALSLNNPKLATAIANEIDKKIFAPIKEGLQKNYHPLTSNTAEGENSQPPLNDVLEKIKDIPMERVLMTGTPPMPSKPDSSLKIVPQPINLPITEKELVKPMMSPPNTPLVGLPIPTPKPSAPAPIMLHQEVTIAPTTNAPVLRSGNLVSKNLMENTPGSAAPPPPPPVARLEYEHKEGDKPRIVNYSAENLILPTKPSAPPDSLAQKTEMPAPRENSVNPPRSPMSLRVSVLAASPKAPIPMQNNTPANIPPPATPSAPNLASISGKPIPHMLDLSPKPPPPPKPSV